MRAAASEPARSGGGALAHVYSDIAAYYSAKVARFGATPNGVDWTCQATQEMRFVQLLKLCDFTSSFSLNDYGCGYGALIAYLDRRHRGCAIDYLGIDLSRAMVQRARQKWRDRNAADFVLGHASPRTADYAVASGIFNVAREQTRQDWEHFIAASLDDLHRTTTRGFAVNFMKRAPGTAGREGLYTTDTASWARHCAARFNATAEVRDGYGLMEFTLIVRKL
ncbi:class I SAM-dependent methyltransferase [Bradyrhizobium amphicarpaeae]|uniref:Class I SAM-dependent methyltransferase n=1 Tax=Bradyrhizobium amphicarpaeae TaxID=1404768 RepID=A0A2U8PZK7_9BRAD|nr:class I SAM-dependent methyltransferase [Bradyrhizobium amphicarpaeae]AWM03253.1 class I SAM-dependent methyltransferase [Bradyrhizobium amphicarpaeae]